MSLGCFAVPSYAEADTEAGTEDDEERPEERDGVMVLGGEGEEEYSTATLLLEPNGRRPSARATELAQRNVWELSERRWEDRAEVRCCLFVYACLAIDRSLSDCRSPGASSLAAGCAAVAGC